MATLSQKLKKKHVSDYEGLQGLHYLNVPKRKRNNDTIISEQVDAHNLTADFTVNFPNDHTQKKSSHVCKSTVWFAPLRLYQDGKKDLFSVQGPFEHLQTQGKPQNNCYH
jgi:hypothetical protein